MFEWNSSADNDIRKMRRQGVPYRAIALRLSVLYNVKLSKNAVIGRAARIGVEKTHMPTGRDSVKSTVVRNKTVSNVQFVRRPESQPTLPAKSGRRNLVSVGGGKCQFIIGEPSGRNFCGGQVVQDLNSYTAAPVWCQKHIDVVYQPPAPKREREERKSQYHPRPVTSYRRFS